MACYCWKQHEIEVSVECLNTNSNKKDIELQWDMDISYEDLFHHPGEGGLISLRRWSAPSYKGCTVLETSDLNSYHDLVLKLHPLLLSKGFRICCVRLICLKVHILCETKKTYDSLLVSVKTNRQSVVCEECLTARVIQESSQRVDSGFVPASELSLSKLLKKSMEVEDKAECVDCRICLEDINAGEDVIEMPCSHTFHETCIDKWLHVSHYCPLCRYELATATTESATTESE